MPPKSPRPTRKKKYLGRKPPRITWYKALETEILTLVVGPKLRGLLTPSAGIRTKNQLREALSRNLNCNIAGDTFNHWLRATGVEALFARPVAVANTEGVIAPTEAPGLPTLGEPAPRHLRLSVNRPDPLPQPLDPRTPMACDVPGAVPPGPRFYTEVKTEQPTMVEVPISVDRKTRDEIVNGGEQ